MTNFSEDARIQKGEENDVGEPFITCQTIAKWVSGRVRSVNNGRRENQ